MDPTILNCTKADFDQILQDLPDFWGSYRARHLHHPFLLNEFGNTAFVVKEGDAMVAYLFGFLSQTEPIGYVHLLAVRNTRRGHGLGRAMYEHFIVFARAHGCTAIKAITSPENGESITFHQKIGTELLGAANEAGIPVVKDYAGPGQHRVVFRRAIS